MPINQYHVEVVAADRKLFSGDAVSLVVPGVDGYFGVLRGHAPMVSAMGIGEIDITPPENMPIVRIAVEGGFVQVMPDQVTILADAAELAEEIDIERARMAKERAEERLRMGGADTDVDRAQAALMRALNRMRVAEHKIG